MTNEKSIDQLHDELMFAMFEVYRAIKADPKHQDKVEATLRHVRMIGQHYADQGAQAVRQFLDAFEDNHGEHASEWLWRRWDGLRLPDGGVWCS